MSDCGKKIRLVGTLGLLFFFSTARAEAHLVTTGLGPVYDGVVHFARSVDDLLPALALALYAGLRGPLPGRRTLFALPLAWFAGGMITLALSSPPAFPPAAVNGVLAVTFIVCGLLVAADLRLPPAAVVALALGLGLIHGFINGLAMRADGATVGTATLQLLGVAATLFVLVALAAGLVVALRPHWTRIAVRAAGSWIAAMGLLWLGWSLSGRG